MTQTKGLEVACQWMRKSSLGDSCGHYVGNLIEDLEFECFPHGEYTDAMPRFLWVSWDSLSCVSRVTD